MKASAAAKGVSRVPSAAATPACTTRFSVLTPTAGCRSVPRSVIGDRRRKKRTFFVVEIDVAAAGDENVGRIDEYRARVQRALLRLKVDHAAPNRRIRLLLREQQAEGLHDIDAGELGQRIVHLPRGQGDAHRAVRGRGELVDRCAVTMNFQPAGHGAL